MWVPTVYAMRDLDPTHIFWPSTAQLLPYLPLEEATVRLGDAFYQGRKRHTEVMPQGKSKKVN
jgi:hypothetical protein